MRYDFNCPFCGQIVHTTRGSEFEYAITRKVIHQGKRW